MKQEKTPEVEPVLSDRRRDFVAKRLIRLIDECAGYGGNLDEMQPGRDGPCRGRCHPRAHRARKGLEVCVHVVLAALKGLLLELKQFSEHGIEERARIVCGPDGPGLDRGKCHLHRDVVDVFVSIGLIRHFNHLPSRGA